MDINEEIRLAGSDAEVVRTGGNVATYLYHGYVGSIAGRRRIDAEYSYEAGYYLPTTSDAVSGDIILWSGSYYLIMAIKPVILMGEVVAKAGLLYETNAVVSIFAFNPTTRKHDISRKSGVRCLVTQKYAQDISDDKALMIREFRGRSTPFQFYAQEGTGLEKDDVVVDQDGRRYRVSRDFDVYRADGVIKAQILWEN